jgi:OOP family OmpA-OmpF porin
VFADRTKFYSLLLTALAFGLAGVFSTFVAIFSVSFLETRMSAEVGELLYKQNMTWVTVESDGMIIRLKGIAPNEVERFRAINQAGRLVGAERLRNKLKLRTKKKLESPHFSVAMLRNDDGISLIGLIDDHAAIQQNIGIRSLASCLVHCDENLSAFD